jgi:hypothetical protein
MKTVFQKLILHTLEKRMCNDAKKVAPLKQVSVTFTPSKDQKKVCIEIKSCGYFIWKSSLPDIQELLIQRIEEFINTLFWFIHFYPVIFKLKTSN